MYYWCWYELAVVCVLFFSWAFMCWPIWIQDCGFAYLHITLMLFLSPSPLVVGLAGRGNERSANLPGKHMFSSTQDWSCSWLDQRSRTMTRQTKSGGPCILHNSVSPITIPINDADVALLLCCPSLLFLAPTYSWTFVSGKCMYGAHENRNQLYVVLFFPPFWLYILL